MPRRCRVTAVGPTYEFPCELGQRSKITLNGEPGTCERLQYINDRLYVHFYPKLQDSLYNIPAGLNYLLKNSRLVLCPGSNCQNAGRSGHLLRWSYDLCRCSVLRYLGFGDIFFKCEHTSATSQISEHGVKPAQLSSIGPAQQTT